MGWSSDHNNNVGTPSAVVHNNQCLGMVTETGSEDWGLELTGATSIAARSFSYTVTTRFTGAGANMECYALALDLDDRGSKVGLADSPTSGSTWTPPVSLGFTPQYVGLVVNRLASENSPQAQSALSGTMGISSNTGSSEETFHGWYNEDNAETINTNNNFRSRVLDLRDDDVSTVEHDYSHSSFNSGDWTYTINTLSDGSVRKWFYWSIEEATEAGDVVLPGSGSLVITGQLPTLLHNRIISPASGSVVLTGQVPVSSVGVIVSPDSGSVVLTGQTPTLQRADVTLPDSGLVVLTGQAPIVLEAKLILPDSGAVTITGQVPISSVGVIVSPDSGSVILTGQTPTIQQQILTIPGSGTVTLTGQLPIVVQSILTQPGSGSVVLSGQVPVVLVGIIKSPGVGSVVLTGQIPTLLHNYIIQPGSGTVTLTGFAPSLGELALPGSGSIVLTGQTPTIQQQILTFPGVGSIIFTGFVPVSITSGAGLNVAVTGVSVAANLNSVTPWLAVPGGPSGGWTPVDDSQTPGWVEIAA